jgi:hypothetical protein
LLNKCFKPLLTHTKILNADLSTNHYQLLEFSNLLPNLTSLTISNTKLSLTSFKQAIANLEKLEILSIEMVIFFYYAGESNTTSTIPFPNSLKHINWHYCRLYLCNLEEDPKKLNYKYTDILTDWEFLTIPPVNLPNLKKLTTMIGPFPLNTELLLANPQLKSLNFEIGEFNEALFSIFDFIKNIKELELNVTLLQIGLNMDLVGWFSVPNLTNFYFNDAGLQNWPLIMKIIESSPNITDIRMMVENKAIIRIMDSFKKVAKLEKLLIVAEDERKVDLDGVSLSRSLKHLELGINLNTKKMLKNYQHNTHLKVISVYNTYFTPKFVRELKQETTPSPWRLIKFKDASNYYRVPLEAPIY